MEPFNKVVDRKQAFYEVGNGKLGREVQDKFEESARVACARNAPVTLTLKITITPPKDEDIGGVSYTLSRTDPTRKSLSYEALFNKGMISATAPDNIGVLQESLFHETEDFKTKERNLS